MYWITGILGVLFIAAPILSGYTDNTPALLTSIIAGGVVLAMSGLEFLKEDREVWEYWVVGISGIVAIISPFVLDYSGRQIAIWTTLLLGVMVALVAGSKIYVSNPKV
jgi:hypothetical protein